MEKFCDNQAETFHECTTHIDIDYRAICNKMLHSPITTHVGSSSQLENILTKGLTFTLYKSNSRKLVFFISTLELEGKCEKIWPFRSVSIKLTCSPLSLFVY